MATAPTPVTKELKRLLLTMIVLVVVLDGIIIGLYHVLRIADRPVKTQETFVAVWVVITLLVVTTMMRRIRVARRGQ